MQYWHQITTLLVLAHLLLSASCSCIFCIICFSNKLGCTTLLSSSSLVMGEVQCFSNHCSIAPLSYVWPSLANTGSHIISCNRNILLHRNCKMWLCSGTAVLAIPAVAIASSVHNLRLLEESGGSWGWPLFFTLHRLVLCSPKIGENCCDLFRTPWLPHTVLYSFHVYCLNTFDLLLLQWIVRVTLASNTR